MWPIYCTLIGGSFTVPLISNWRLLNTILSRSILNLKLEIPQYCIVQIHLISNLRFLNTVSSRYLKGKMKRGNRLKANHFTSWSRPMKVISDVPVSRNWYKTVSKELTFAANSNFVSLYLHNPDFVIFVSLSLKYQRFTFTNFWKRRYPRET